MKLTARAARLEDAAAITEIYNQGIEDRVAIFETEPRDVADILPWFEQTGRSPGSRHYRRLGAGPRLPEVHTRTFRRSPCCAAPFSMLPSGGSSVT
jgi:hypothetical protein